MPKPQARSIVLLIGLSLLWPGPALAWDWFRSENRHVRQGNEALRSGDAQGALASYERAARELPSEPGVHLNRGLALLAQGKHKEAREAFGRAFEPPAPRETRASAYYNAGLSFYREADALAAQGDHANARILFRQAADAFRQSLRFLPGNRDAAWNLELALRRERQEEEEDKKEKEQQKEQQKQEQSENSSDGSQQNQDQQKQQSQKEPSDQSQSESNQPKAQENKEEQSKSSEQEKSNSSGQEQKPQEQQAGSQGEPKAEPPPNPSPEERARDRLSPEHLRMLDALGDREINLERAKARIRAERERRKPLKDW
ncbi:MAG: tetratricopeptide repeat protein [Sandaracinaceae bacterium]|nr:tetratricopeptide repeat protein [Sandaracinaceae bacterium]